MTYFVERFPLATVIPVAVMTAIIEMSFVSSSPFNAALAGLVALAFLAFLLRQRVTDEFKDASHDGQNYPDRPVQRGAISRNALVALGATALVVEIGSVIAASALGGSLENALWYLPFLGWSALTSVEFFAHDWLNRRFTLYFISHQLIFVWLGLWAAFATGTTLDTLTVAGIASFVLLMAAVEIVRKFEIRRDPSGEIVEDTYPAVWGTDQTVTVLCALIGTVGALTWWRDSEPWGAMISAVAIGLLAFGNRTQRTVQSVLAVVLVGYSVVAVLR